MSIKPEGRILYKETRRILKDAKENNRLVLFVGAGASMDPGMPSWSQAIEQIASKLPLSNQDKMYDPLKIPQYYYNSRGKKEYTQLMREVFLHGTPLKTTMLHKKLIECQAETIITTNYDHLIEQAAEENSEVRYVISKDSDLSYKNSSRELVKMHGDFENDNFVLKEDDYLQYSRNFGLIETYIKSLLGSKVVLFVGYSLNDPDVKQIITWVKDVLKDDFQRAYLLLANTEKNEIERDYFRNLGVNLIYTSELIEKWDEKKHTEQLVEFFDFILEDEEEKILDRVYNELKPFQNLNYVYGKYVRNALRRVKILCRDDEVDLSDSMDTKDEENKKFKHLLWGYLNDGKVLEEYSMGYSDENKLQVIKEALDKSCIKVVRRKIDGKYCEAQLSDDVVNQIVELVYTFDYQKLDEIKKHNQMKLSGDLPDLYMQQAYICALLNDYYTAYNCLKNASKIYYRNKNYTWYFLAEFNRKYVGKVCLDFFEASLLSKEELAQLQADVNMINIEQILETIPDLGNNHNQFLKELSDFTITYNLFYNMFSDTIEVSQQAKTAYSIFAGKAAYEKMRSRTQDYNDYETCNYIILDRYNEVRSLFLLYLRSVLSSVMAEKMSDFLSNEDIFDTGNIKQDKLTSFEIYIILRYLSQSDFKKLIKEYDIKFLPCDEDAIQYIEKISNSMFCAKNYIRQTSFHQDIFWVYFELVSHVKISENLAIKVLKHLCSPWKEEDLRSNNQSINRFLINLYNEKYYQNSSVFMLARKMLDNVLDLLNKDSSIQGYLRGMVSDLVYLCKQSGNGYNDLERINTAVDKCGVSFCVNIFANLGREAQKPINEFFDNWKPSNTADEYCLYCDAVLAQIIEPDSNIEKRIYKWIKSMATIENSEDDTRVITFPKEKDYSDVIKELVNLFLTDRIIEVNTLREVAEQFGDMISQWLLNQEGFDYDYFDCHWLTLCRSGLLHSIAKNDIARNGILAAYKKQYDSGAVSKDVESLIIKYFISPIDEVENEE